MEPKCPDCGIIGIKHIVATESEERSQGGDPWFEIAHCDKCGHVYGVFPKIVHKPSIKVPSFE